MDDFLFVYEKGFLWNKYFVGGWIFLKVDVFLFKWMNFLKSGCFLIKVNVFNVICFVRFYFFVLNAGALYFLILN